MLYRMITSIEKDVGRIAGNASTHAPLMAQALTSRWRDQLPEGQQVVDLLQTQNCLRNDLHVLRQEIRVIEKEHLAALEKARIGRGVRDVALPRVRETLLGIQSLFEGNYGAGSSRIVFGDEFVAIPRDAFSLRRLAKIAHERLTDPLLVLPEGQLGGVQIVPMALAQSFEEPLQELDEALQKLEDKLLPSTSESLERKLRTLAELRKQAGRAARFLEALYFLAGHDEIAQRVRLSSHRPRNTETPEDDSPEESTPDESKPEESTPEELDETSPQGAAEVTSQEVG